MLRFVYIPVIKYDDVTVVQSAYETLYDAIIDGVDALNILDYHEDPEEVSQMLERATIDADYEAAHFVAHHRYDRHDVATCTILKRHVYQKFH